MNITVLPIIEPDVKPAAPLTKVMNERLTRLAKELQDVHLKELENAEPMFDDIVIYIGYNSKYSIRWKIVNDVPDHAITAVATACDRLGYIRWKTATLNAFNRK